MMQVYVNQRMCAFPLEPEATLGEVLDTLQVELEPGHIVTQIRVDGRTYHAAEQERFVRQRVESVKRLNVRTQSPEEFASEKRIEVGRSMHLIADRARRTAQLFEQGEIQGANTLLAAVMEELRLALVLDQQLAQLTIREGGGSKPPAEIEQVAKALLEAQEKNAWQNVGKLLEDKLVPILHIWASERAQSDRRKVPVEQG